MKSMNSGQNVIEYLIIMVIILIAVLNSNLINRIKGGFETYRNRQANRISTWTNQGPIE